MPETALKSFQINQEKYAGPLDALLSLIEGKKMEITDIALAKITDDFLSFLGDIKMAEPIILADFLTVAARLLQIKSKAILPSLEIGKEEEMEIADFKERLEIYRRFREAAKNIKESYLKNQLFSREFLASRQPVFCPPPDLSAEKLSLVFAKIWSDFQSFQEEIQVEKIVKIVKIEEKIKEILDILSKNSTLSFNSLGQKADKSGLIAGFLAILQLFKDQKIIIEQKELFGEIQVSKSL